MTENYGTAKSSVFDNLNRMTSSLSGAKTYTHDLVGNRKFADQGTARQTMTWDATNRMTGITCGGTPGANPVPVWGTNAEYAYRADGLRTQKVVHPNLGVAIEEGEPSSFFDFNYMINDATTRYFYDGQMCASEDYVAYVEGSTGYVNEDVTNYTLGARGIDMIEAVRIKSAPNDTLLNSPKTSYPIYDGHGNMLATLVKVKDSGGNVTGAALTNEKRFDAWGAAFVSSGPGGALVNPNTSYCANLGHKEDSESGLTYMRARYYEPGTGRFISQDPGFDGQNYYSYCRNNPTNLIDRTGNEAGLIGFFIELLHEAEKQLREGNFDPLKFDGLKVLIKGAGGFVEGLVTKWCLTQIAAVVSYTDRSCRILMASGNLAAAETVSTACGYAIILLLFIDAIDIIGTESLIDCLYDRMSNRK